MSYIWGKEKSLTTLLMNARVSYYTYDRGSLLFKSIYVYLCEWHIGVYFLCIHIVSCICIIKIVNVLIFKNNLCIGNFSVCSEDTWFLVLNERCTPGG